VESSRNLLCPRCDATRSFCCRWFPLSLSPAFLPSRRKKKKKKKTDPSSSSDTSKTLIPLTDEQQIDYTLSDMLGAWQLGDIEKLHKD